jgi:hypothetical protein
MKQTAVEWLFQELDNYYQMEGNVIKKEILKQAKEMEKEQQGYSEEEVRKLLQSQRGNCYVAILTKTRDTELASFATLAPEPGGKDGWVKQSKKK